MLRNRGEANEHLTTAPGCDFCSPLLLILELQEAILCWSLPAPTTVVYLIHRIVPGALRCLSYVERLEGYSSISTSSSWLFWVTWYSRKPFLKPIRKHSLHCTFSILILLGGLENVTCSLHVSLHCLLIFVRGWYNKVFLYFKFLCILPVIFFFSFLQHHIKTDVSGSLIAKCLWKGSGWGFSRTNSAVPRLLCMAMIIVPFISTWLTSREERSSTNAHLKVISKHLSALIAALGTKWIEHVQLRSSQGRFKALTRSVHPGCVETLWPDSRNCSLREKQGKKALLCWPQSTGHFLMCFPPYFLYSHSLPATLLLTFGHQSGIGFKSYC